MIDVNYPLRKAYISALSTVGCEVYNIEAPDNIDAQAYIVISDLSSSDNRTKTSQGTETGIKITIHTWSEKYNAGKSVDEYAEDVLNAIYPGPVSTLDLGADGLQVVNTTFDSDTMNYGNLGDRQYVSRMITFKHQIFIQ